MRLVVYFVGRFQNYPGYGTPRSAFALLIHALRINVVNHINDAIPSALW